jgi:3'(2'), 5'-bisphosphate nucleotidase
MINKVIIEKLVDLVKICHQEILKIYNSDDFNIEIKSDNSPLTKADKVTNDIICQELKNISNYKILSEESKGINFNDRSKEEYLWVVDPIDGTKEFIKKNGEFTVNIGLLKNNKPYFGIVGIPCKDEIYYGGSTFNSFFLNCKTNKTKQIFVNKFSLNDDNLNIVASKSHNNEETIKFISQFKNSNINSYGSSIKILKVADGTSDIYPRIAPTMEWDTCASHSVLLGSGGRIVSFDSWKNENIEIKYNKNNLLNPYFVCIGKLTN